MKKFAVLQKIGRFDARAIREFDHEKDAVAFAGLMAKSEEDKNTKFFIAKDICECVSCTAQPTGPVG